MLCEVVKKNTIKLQIVTSLGILNICSVRHLKRCKSLRFSGARNFVWDFFSWLSGVAKGAAFHL